MKTGLSARPLGQRYGLNAAEMNAILKEEGFLTGVPGHYRPTEKGKKFLDNNKRREYGHGSTNGRGWGQPEWKSSIRRELHITEELKHRVHEEFSCKQPRESVTTTKESSESNNASYLKSKKALAVGGLVVHSIAKRIKDAFRK